MTDVHSALVSCPNISTLDLRVTMLGCSESPDRWSFPFDLAGGEKYPALETLSLEGYDFKTRTGPGYNRQGTLDSLDTLHVESSWAREFILALRPNTLKDLTWIKSGQPLDSVLDHHDESLTRLERRTPDSMAGLGPELTPEELHSLGTKAPHLRDLTIDVHRNGTWPWDHLRAISASLYSVTNLTIYLEMASKCRQQKTRAWANWPPGDDDCCGEDQWGRPLLNSTSSLEVFEFLRAHKVGGELTRVKFYVGDWSRPWDGPDYISPWIEGKKAWIECGITFGNGTRKGEADTFCWGEDTVIPAWERCGFPQARPVAPVRIPASSDAAEVEHDAAHMDAGDIVPVELL
ncbi:hypothetical protein NKR23_g8623 [Pleurostoma richardsiae]|uniref:Uncharacterized protein n=1 Tax=Pleurostoma richardsiae TaxID=41990 RepID=A0AA38VFH0_9PEZI|nr:hypothetical protein NKR23_g8623 [Pleurostoma richardsiae]